MASRMRGHQARGTGGSSQGSGSERSPEWVGMTSVPRGDTALCSADMTATAPPQTQPSALKEEWTRRTSPELRPSAFRSSKMESSVKGLGAE